MHLAPMPRPLTIQIANDNHGGPSLSPGLAAALAERATRKPRQSVWRPVRFDEKR